MPGAGSGLHCRGTAPTSHMQCNSNAPRGRPRSRPHAHRLPTAHPSPPQRAGTRGYTRVTTVPWTQALARQQSPLGPQSCSFGLPRLLQPGGDGQGVERPPPADLQGPAPPLTLSMELPAVVVARLSCRYPLAFSQRARLAGPASVFLRPSRARAALKESRAALGKGLLWGPGRRSGGQSRRRPSEPPSLVPASWRSPPHRTGLGAGPHSLRLLQGAGQALHQWVQPRGSLLVPPQPVRHHSRQRGPPLGHRVCA